MLEIIFAISLVISITWIGYLLTRVSELKLRLIQVQANSEERLERAIFNKAECERLTGELSACQARLWEFEAMEQTGIKPATRGVLVLSLAEVLERHEELLFAQSPNSQVFVKDPVTGKLRPES